VDEVVAPTGVCVDWHTPGPAGIGAAGEMWMGYQHPVRPEILIMTRDFAVIHVLPTTTAKTGSSSIKRTIRGEELRRPVTDPGHDGGARRGSQFCSRSRRFSANGTQPRPARPCRRQSTLGMTTLRRGHRLVGVGLASHNASINLDHHDRITTDCWTRSSPAPPSVISAARRETVPAARRVKSSKVAVLVAPSLGNPPR
jgi:hypothetical protein